MVNFDTFLDVIGPFGRYQKIHTITLYLVIIPSGIQNLLNIYLLATPEHWCDVRELANLSVQEQIQLTAPLTQSYANDIDASCMIRDFNYSEVYLAFVRNESYNVNISELRQCSNWQYDYSVYGTTGVTKWNLVCSNASLPAMAQSIYMFGFLLGAFLIGYSSDRFGRKITLYGSVVGVIVFALLSCVQQNLWAHIILRMIAGVAACGCITVAFIIVMEMIGPTKRMIPGLSAQVFFALGYMIVSFVAYFARGFVLTNAILSALPIVFLCYWWTEPESARWLLAHGRVEEAKTIMKKMAKTNKVSIDADALVNEFKDEEIDLSTNRSDSSHRNDKHYTVLDIVRTPNMRKKSANILFNCAELFPTVVRTIGVGMGSMSARLGGLVAPFVTELKIFWLPLPTIIFGLFALVAGFLSFLLPETLGEKLPDTLEEGEAFGKDMKLLECYYARRRRSGRASAIDDQDGQQKCV
ncbi:hypothetical protein LSH36_32g10016 [Paralvinella palmiformis]|uniref:Major facilitator superfamily (MFS) profile domain-containing protein n=1 Tax=Paralvinella palmiformis TaxID=53620 RepID=A0AAD9K900_9ANNE|nr:hypothetical protein LSH36_32g10016 [Paralvinella palmiformis]